MAALLEKFEKGANANYEEDVFESSGEILDSLPKPVKFDGT